jgi:hypothetical protein
VTVAHGRAGEEKSTGLKTRRYKALKRPRLGPLQQSSPLEKREPAPTGNLWTDSNAKWQRRAAKTRRKLSYKNFTGERGVRDPKGFQGIVTFGYARGSGLRVYAP